MHRTQQVAARQLESGLSYIRGIVAVVAESLDFVENDRLQQHNTRPSGLNQIHVLYWTVCTAGQFGLLYYSIIQSTVVQYSTLFCLCLESSRSQTIHIDFLVELATTSTVLQHYR